MELSCWVPNGVRHHHRQNTSPCFSHRAALAQNDLILLLFDLIYLLPNHIDILSDLILFMPDLILLLTDHILLMTVLLIFTPDLILIPPDRILLTSDRTFFPFFDTFATRDGLAVSRKNIIAL